MIVKVSSKKVTFFMQVTFLTMYAVSSYKIKNYPPGW